MCRRLTFSEDVVNQTHVEPEEDEVADVAHLRNKTQRSEVQSQTSHMKLFATFSRESAFHDLIMIRVMGQSYHVCGMMMAMIRRMAV